MYGGTYLPSGRMPVRSNNASWPSVQAPMPLLRLRVMFSDTIVPNSGEGRP
jgi:hypothetical protein